MRNWKLYSRTILDKYKITPSKKLGQNFLVQYRVVNSIIKYANISENDKILEIGGGVGILTYGLSKTKANITVIETDPRFVDHLNIEFPNIEVIKGNALNVDWPENIKLISNLPYSISSQVVSKLVHHNYDLAVIMLQKEVANRCIAQPGDKQYSRLSILCQLHAKVEQLFDVSPDAFYPSPKVTSSVIRITPKLYTYNNPHTDIELLTRNLFSLKRRQLRGVIRGFLKNKNVNNSVWENLPYKNKRIFNLNTYMLDEILTYLKEEEAWPIA